IVTGFTKPLGSQDDEDFYIVKLDAQGNETWHFETGDQFNEFGEDVIETQDGGFVSTGYKMFDTDSEGDLYLIKVDANGDSLWAYTFGVPVTWERGFTITEAPNGDLVAAGNSTINNEGVGYWVRTDSDGHLLREKFLTLSNAIGYPGNILPTPDNGFIVAGTGDSIVAMIKTDSLLNSFTTYIQGNIFHDIDDDCQFDSGEQSLEGWTVVADGTDDYFSITDAQGNYSILADTGDYVLSVISPNELWATCPTYEAFPLILNDLFDTTQLDLPIQSVVDCPHLTVDISAPQLRRCFDNTYYIKYCNDGTSDEANAFVEVQFDPYLTVNASNLNYVDLGGNLFSFDVGDVEVGACGEFSVSVYVDCDSTVLGQTHCVEAHIFPDSFCLIPMTVWDSSSFTVDGTCAGDSVIFEFRNVGTASPTTPRVASIIQDDIIVFIYVLDLNPGQSDSLVLYPQGATVRAEVQQSEGHPGQSMPTSVIEGCGASPASWSLGYVTQFPMDDGNHFVDVDCQENIGSYDPNDKAAYPRGYFSENFINSEDEIEYHIRFQNTGTDTAFTVVIRDTLSEFLDPTTIRTGASSHAYEFELLNNGILKFTFDNILLPDSATNLVASNGFVKFKIAQRPNNLPGTVITNSAAIYFDFNLPIITNEVVHTIEIPTEYVVHKAEICEGEIYNGVVIERDTLLIDTVETSFAKDVHLTLIDLLEHSYSDSSVVLSSGADFGGDLIFQDTIIVLQTIAANGCDSFQTIEISVAVDDPFQNHFNFNTYPNPVEDVFFVEYTLPKRDFITIELYDVLGKKVATLLDHNHQLAGKHTLRVDAKDLNVNVLFLHWQSASARIVEKVVFEN
ncbi:MAG: T9SS type A sorting domain-containing protein, partial [Bacteroidota bacterium]